jgi:2-polyprenyl-6-methoxyphenol hydroxylase-like FAD-dependent oxidoreductase
MHRGSCPLNTDALIVGAGPVGLTMAAELARYRVPVRIIDKALRRTDKSKALVLWSRSLELIDRMGCGPSFVDAGMQVTGINITAAGSQIAHVSLDAVETTHPYALMIPQSETERLMEQHLNRCGVEVERGVELVRFTPAGERVIAVLRHPDQHEETLELPWLLGCDGAHSSVRHGLGMAFEGDTLPSDWILADLHLTGGPNPPNELALFWHGDGVLVMFPISPGRFRVIADVDAQPGDAQAGGAQPGPHPADPTLKEVQALLDRRGPGGIQASNPIWLAGFRINERKVADYRAERVFVLGDAAHVHSPAGGQGMNTGIQDAVNLAWKLALVNRGLAGPEPLLQSYSTERSEIGRKVLADAGRLTTVATLRSGLLQSLRNHVAPLLLGLPPVRRAMTNAMAELSIGYPDGPLSRTGGAPPSGPAAGERMPVRARDRPIGAGDTPRFALFGQASAESAALIARHRDILEPETRVPSDGNGIWLVRPDGYVAMTSAHADWAKIGAYLDWITARAVG